MFIAHNKVRMHDTDMAGILYFARQFRFAHDAIEDFVSSEGLGFDFVFRKNHFVFVIVHCEADYLASMTVGDELEVHMNVEHIGTTSFSLKFNIFRLPKKELVGTAKTVHVTLDAKTRTKVPIPDILKKKLEKHLYIA